MEGASSWRTLEAARPGNAGSRLTNPSNTMDQINSSQLHPALSRGSFQGQNGSQNQTSQAQNQHFGNLLQPALVVVSVNIEGFSQTKSQILADFCDSIKCDILCEETHRDSTQSRPQIPGMTLVAEIPHPKYGSAVFTKPCLSVQSASCSSENNIEILTLDTGNCTVSSVYKPPNTPFHFSNTSNFHSQPIKIIVGDFNSHSTTWGYAKNDSDGDAVEEWAKGENLALIHDAKLPPSQPKMAEGI